VADAVPNPPSAIPDVVGAGLACIFCGINPGRVSAAAAAHFANPRNDFWRLLHDAGFTPRLYEPHEQFGLLELRFGVTNAAARTTPGSGDLRRGDFDLPRLEQVSLEFRPRTIAFVGKEAYRGLFDERPELGPQLRTLRPGTGLFVLPSTSPANAAVPYDDRLRWFRELRAWIEPEPRQAVRAIVLDATGRVLLCEFTNQVTGARWWGTPGGGIEPGETDEAALRRELFEETGLASFELGPVVLEHEHVFPWAKHLYRQNARFHLVRVDAYEPAPTIDLAPEGVASLRWWTLDELEQLPAEEIAPPHLPQVLRGLLS
jgi:TDG/mug DNA glycosylase family protein